MKSNVFVRLQPLPGTALLIALLVHAQTHAPPAAQSSATDKSDACPPGDDWLSAIR